VQTYWGQKLPNRDDYPRPCMPNTWSSFESSEQQLNEEYPAYGGLKYDEPCLVAAYHDGTRDTILSFEAHQATGDQIRLTLADRRFSLYVTLVYITHRRENIIEKKVTIVNRGREQIVLSRAFSARWHVHSTGVERLSHMGGRWNDEFKLKREVIESGTKVLESRRLNTSHEHSPFFFIDRNANEENGQVWFGSIQWSGNWKICTELSEFGQIFVSCGTNDWDSEWNLQPGESHTTPSSIGGYTNHGFGAASRVLHDYVRNKLTKRGSTVSKVLYNSWEATQFNVDEESQGKLAEISAEMGVELFVIDDGWFHGRNNDSAGLGDWRPDEKKFPNGLGKLISKVNNLGMSFGLWVEPEMVNADSDLYRKYPEWVISFPSRQKTESRNQMILNLAIVDVQNYLIEVLDTILAQNNIEFIKWDMNRSVSEPGFANGYNGNGREIWIRYVEGLYRVWQTLADKHPNVTWQSCSGGGGRADFGILQLADQIWPSDNTSATARLQIQEGFSMAFPAKTMEAWVTDSDENHKIPLKFRFHVSMLGSLGVGGNLPNWSEDEIDVAKEQIELYKKIRNIVQLGDLYRLKSSLGGGYSAVQYVSKDMKEAVIFCV